MRSLLDVNVLIALLDQDHASHARAMAWFQAHAQTGWASCPLTQNGCVRIMSHAGYPNALSTRDVMARLSEATRHQSHAFWADSVSLLDSNVVNATRIHGPKQLTDIYLLALAVANEGRLVTFDKTIALESVINARRSRLLFL